MTTYTVTAKPKHGFDPGHDFTIEAKNKAEAISKARKLVARDWIYDRHDGPIVYSATEAL